MTKQLEFDHKIWKELLKLQQGKEELTGKLMLSEFPDLSNRAIYSYLFALKNRNRLSNEIGQIMFLKKLESVNKSLIKDKKLIEKELLNADERLNFMYGIQVLEGHSFESIKIKENVSLKEENTVITLLSDGHVDEVVVKETVNGLNEYNPDIAKQRIEFYFSRILYMVRMLRRGGMIINNLVLGILGDMISGYIHEALMESNSMSPIEGTEFVQELLIRGIKMLYEDGEFDKITIIGARGNHSRTSKKKKFKTGWKNSYEYLMHKNIKKVFEEYLKYDIEYVISKSEFSYVDIYNKKIRFSHLDHFKYAGGIGGVMVPMNRWLYKINEVIKADLSCGGHWHTRMNIPGLLVNGSVIGYNEYAMGYGFKPENPQMQFQLLDKKRGLTMNIPIYLNDF